MAASETPSVRSLLETKSRVLIMNTFARSSARIPITHPTLKQGFYPPSDAYFNKFLVSRVRSSYTKALDLFEDGVGIGSPVERFGILVVVGQIVAYS